MTERGVSLGVMTPQPDVPTTVFAAAFGEYSNYRYEAIFSTEALAQAWIDKHENARDFHIEPWLVDQEAAAESITVWECWIAMESGEIFNRKSRREVGVPFRGVVCQSAAKITLWHGTEAKLVTAAWVQSGVSEEHCAKFAAETRQAWLRKKMEGLGNDGQPEPESGHLAIEG